MSASCASRGHRTTGVRRARCLLGTLTLVGCLLSVGSAWAAPRGSHGGDQGAHHVPHLSDVNWYYGLLGEREGVEPSLLWRTPGMPVPVAAMALNTLLLLWLLIRFGGPLVRAGLTSRKQRVESGIQSAAAMKREAEQQLAHYEGKLARIDQEIENVRAQMREQAEAERKRVLAEARLRHEQMDRDVGILLGQELKAAREDLFHAVVAQAMQAAEETIRRELSPEDHRRLAEELLTHLEGANLGGLLRARSVEYQS